MRRLFPLFAALTIILSSCGGKEPSPKPDPVPDPTPDPTLELSASTLSFKKEGGSEQVDVKSNIAWTATSDAAWCKLVSASGDGNGKLSISVDVNDAYDDRNAVVTVSGKGLVKTVSVFQSKATGLFITKPDYDLSNTAQTVNVEVSTNVELDVKVDESCSSWVSYVTTKGLSTKTLSFDVKSNDTYGMREGWAVVSSKDGALSGRVTFRQAQNLGLKLETSQYSCKADEAEIDVKVLSNVEYEVVIPESESSWLSLVSADTKALSESSFKLKLAKNESYYDREASVTVKQKDGSLAATLKVYQEEAPDPVVVKSDKFDETAVVKSFALLSDIHIQNNVADPTNKFKSALNQLQTLSGGLDAVLVNGDMVQAPGYNGGSDYSEISLFKGIYESVFDPERVPLVYCLGNHDVPWNNMVNGAYNVRNLFGPKYFLHDRDNNSRVTMECRHVQLERTHVLCVTPISTNAAYDPAAVKWLDAQLQSITSKHPEDYVIVLTHPMIYNTVYGSTLYTSASLAWFTKELTGVLEKYNQVIVFGGHLHFPLNDPTSIWQGDFTACGTASVRYMAIENGGYVDMASATTMVDKDEYSEGYLYQIDRSGNVRLTRMDFYRNAKIGEPWELSYPRADRKHLETYSNVKRALKNSAPVMSYVKVNEVKAGLSITYELEFGAAEDDEFAHHYEVKIARDEEEKTLKILSDFYRCPQASDMKKVWKRELGALAVGNYTVKVTAFDSWGVTSNTVTTTFTVEPPKPADPEVYADIDFSAGSVTDSKGKATLTNHSAVISTVTLSHKGVEYSVPAAHLTGMDGYIAGKFNDLATSSSFQSFCNLGFSVEALYVDKMPGSAVHGIFCATEKGGWGLANRATSAPYFIVGDVSSNKYKNVDASAVSTTELTHVVGVYDVAVKKIFIYVNGVLATSGDFTGPFYPGEGDTFNRFIIGGDTKPSVIAGDFPPTDMYVVDAKFYSGALDASAVAKAYADSIDSLK